ncbi:MAG TPA: oligosaccharide flippase family protein [Thermoleophilaceae bacterium]|nr:oligosaccharide flippase family protein [Thermoleophilaceae bacterium]
MSDVPDDLLDARDDRLAFPREELRGRTVRGVLLNALFTGATEGLVLAQGLIVSVLLGPEAIGLYGIVTATAMTIVALKRVGIDEAFVQQSEAGQEEEFQRAFSLELGVSAAFSLAIAVAAPIVAIVYGENQLLALTLAAAYMPLAFALQAPTWIFFRRMDFMRQRVLLAIGPVVTFAVVVTLAALGVGVWSLLIGPAVGNAAAAAAAIAVSPYRLALRFERSAARRYFSFSWPIFVASAAMLVVLQGQLIAFDVWAGIAAVGHITLAYTLTRYADRADHVVASTIYPAICAVRDRIGTLTELFEKSNRAAMIWSVPFCGGIVLFAPDLVEFVLGGDEWEPAVVLLQGLAVATALQQLGFNWFSFYRARGESKPQAVEAAVMAAGFLAFAVPGLALWGATGFVVGRALVSVAMLMVRAHYVKRLLPGVRLWMLGVRGVLPVLAGAAAALALRLVLWDGERPLWQALCELALFLAVTALATRALERDLLREFMRYLRTGNLTPAAA